MYKDCRLEKDFLIPNGNMTLTVLRWRPNAPVICIISPYVTWGTGGLKCRDFTSAESTAGYVPGFHFPSIHGHINSK